MLRPLDVFITARLEAFVYRISCEPSTEISSIYLVTTVSVLT